MNIDLLTLQHTLTRQVGSVNTTASTILDARPDTIEAKVVALAITREAAIQKFLLTLLLPDQKETVRIKSDVAAPRDSTVVLQRINDQWQLIPPSKDQQLQALIQVQQARIPTPMAPLAETWQALQQWQQALQSQTDLPKTAKKQLSLLRELLTLPAVNAAPQTTKPADQSLQKIHQHINTSGVFMEANFANKGRSIATMEDKKWLLMRLFGALKQSQQQSSTPRIPKALLAQPAATKLLNDSVSRAIKTPPELAASHIMPPHKLVHSLPAMTQPNTSHAAPQPSVVTLAIATLSKATWRVVPATPRDQQNKRTTTSDNPAIDSIITPALTRSQNNAVAPSDKAVTNNPILPLLTKTMQTRPQVVNVSGSTSDSRLPPHLNLAMSKASVSHHSEAQWRSVTLPPTTQLALSALQPTIQSLSPPTGLQPLISMSWDEPSHLLDRPHHPTASPFKVAFTFTTTGVTQDKPPIQLAPLSNFENAYLWLLLPSPLAASKPRTETNVDKLIRQVFAGIMRIQSLQLESLSTTREASNASPSSQYWHMDIPLLIGERWQSAQCHIYRQQDEEQHRKAPHETMRLQWGMRLRFELDNLGTLTADAHLVGHQLNTTLWTDTQALQARVNKYRDELLERLREGGLHINDLPCQLGDPPPLPKGKAFHQEVTT